MIRFSQGYMQHARKFETSEQIKARFVADDITETLSEVSADYPLGGMIEPHDIEVEKSLT